MSLTGVVNSLSSYAKELIVWGKKKKTFPPRNTRVPYCRAVPSLSACIYIAKEHIWQMKHFGINSARRKTSGRSRFARSLFSARRSPCFFFIHFYFLLLYLPSSPGSSLHAPFSLFFFFLLLSRRHLPTSGNLQGTNIWEMQFEHLSATKERQTMLEKTRGINTPPTWCWTNMSRCLQFTDGPATASGAHRCGNSRTNLIAPVVPFFFLSVCFWVCLLAVFVLLLSDRSAPSGMRVLKMTAWLLWGLQNLFFKQWHRGGEDQPAEKSGRPAQLFKEQFSVLSAVYGLRRSGRRLFLRPAASFCLLFKKT